MTHMTEAEYEAYITNYRFKGIVNHSTPKDEKPDEGPELPIPLDVDDRYRSQWERQYADYLEQRRHLKEIKGWLFEPMNIRLAANTYYTPDFLVVTPFEMQFHEVKGRKRAKGLVKFKAAREILPWFRWIMVTKVKGEWVEVVI